MPNDVQVVDAVLQWRFVSSGQRQVRRIANAHDFEAAINHHVREIANHMDFVDSAANQPGVRAYGVRWIGDIDRLQSNVSDGYKGIMTAYLNIPCEAAEIVATDQRRMSGAAEIE